MVSVVAPPDVCLAAARGRVRLLGETLTGEGFAQAQTLGERIALGEPLSRDDQLNLRAVLARDAETPELSAVHDLLGGDTAREWLFAAELPVRPLLRLSERLAAVDARLAERILGQLEAVFAAAVARTALKVARKVRSAGVPRGEDPLGWLDAQPASVVRAAVSVTEEAEVAGMVADLDSLLPAILMAAVAETADILDDELGIDVDSERLLPAVDSAVDVAKLSLLALILGRLARNESVVSGQVPTNIAWDVMRVAAGADHSPVGGVPRSATGRVLVAGQEVVGDGFASSQRVVDAVQSEGAGSQRVEAVRRWNHSGALDANSTHKRNDGKREEDCDLSAGVPGGLRNCGCRWVLNFEVVA